MKFNIYQMISFLICLLESNGNKNKRKLDLVKFKSFCTIKETINKSKRPPTNRRKSFKQCHQQGINFQIQITNAGQYQKKETSKLIKTWQKTYRDVSPKNTCKWPGGMWKDAQHDYLLEKSKSKLQWDYHLTGSEWLSSKYLHTINSGQGKGNPFCYSWECKLANPLWRTIWRFLKKLKNRVTMWSSKLILQHISTEKHGSK